MYNGFLAAELVWGLALGNAGQAIKIFFLTCVSITEVVDATTVSRKVLFI